MSHIKMDQDENLFLDKFGKGKSQEQIKKHTVDDSLDAKPIDRAMLLLTKGDDIQKMSIIQALPQLCQIDLQATNSRIIPKIQQDLPSASSEFNVTASVIFSELIESHKFPNLLATVLQNVDCKDPIAANAWMDALLKIIPSLPEGPLKTQVMPLVIKKASMTQSILCRINSCKILGKISAYPKLKLIDIQKDIVPLVLSLCQDVNHEVRATMCTQLPHVTEAVHSGVGKDFMKTNLLPSLVELASDANPIVRGSSVTTVVFMLQYLDNETKANIMLPLVTQLCDKSMRKDDVTAGIIAAELGKMMDSLKNCLSTETSNWFMKCYKKLSQRGLSNDPGDVFSIDVSKEVICRECCAMNLPFMANFTYNTLPAQMDLFYSIFRDLAVDPCYIVRRTVAAHLHEIVQTLKAQSKNLRTDIVRLLRDDAEEVLQALVPGLGKTLVSLQTYGILSREKQDMCTVDVGRAMFKCHMELTKGYNWRLLCLLLEQMEQVPLCMPSDFIHQQFTPSVIGNAINGRARPVRAQAVRTLLVFLRHNSKEVHQKWLRDTLIKQLCYSESSYTRIIYIKLCEHAVDLFPDLYFQEYFFGPLLSLAVDPVSNIRYALVTMLPKLKLVLHNPDTELRCNNQLGEAIRTMEKSEKDRDVKQWLQVKIKEMNNIPQATYKKREESQKVLQTQLVGGLVSVMKVRESGGLNRVYSQVTTSTSRLIAPKDTKPYQAAQNKSQLQVSKSNDMTILSQHFYIDAGVSLPFSTIIPDDRTNFNHGFSPQNQNSSDLLDVDNHLESSTKQLKTLSIPSATNITDDQKVNLRRISRIVPPRVKSISSSIKTKRYSMSHCLDNDKTILNNSEDRRKQTNRRSLNLTSREFSRIPIVNRLNNICNSINDSSLSSNAGDDYTTSNKIVSINNTALATKHIADEPANLNEGRQNKQSTDHSPIKRVSGLPISINR